MIAHCRPYRRLLVFVAALAVWAWSSADGADAPPALEIELRVRLEWGGGPPLRWNIGAEIEGGELRDPIPLGVELDEPGSMWIDDGRLIAVAPSPRIYDGVEIAIRSPRTGKLILTLADGVTTKKMRLEIPVASLVEQPYRASLDDVGNRFSATRAPGDRLRVSIDRPTLVFHPGEMLHLNMVPHLPGLPTDAPLQLSASLLPARRSKVLWNETRELPAPDARHGAWASTKWSIRLPDEEGVYDVVFELYRRDAVNLWRTKESGLVRKVQVVVVSPLPTSRPAGGEGLPSHTIVEIDPSHPGWYDRLKQLTTLPGRPRGPLTNTRTTTRAVGGSTYVVLPPTPEPDDPAWQSYPLPVSRPGVPHVIELEYPADAPQALAVSLIEPNDAGSVAPMQVDTGLYVEAEETDAASPKRVRRWIVWPRTSAPLLTIANGRRDVPASFGKIRLLGPRVPTPVLYPWQDETPTTLPAANFSETPADGRLLAAYYDRPLFPENFGMGTALDPACEAPRCLDDWLTYFEGARRLVEYLKHVGYNGVLLTVVADGAAIYPSAIVGPTPRYDDGVFFATGQDPIRKDILEMLLRICDREKLRVVVGVQFTAPLPRLEALQRGGASGIAPRGLDGRTFTEVHPTSGEPAPFYNPLDPRVQDEMLAVVRELRERYGAHSSLAGAAVQLAAEGYAQLPGVEWCLDDETIGRFLSETETKLPSPADASKPSAVVLERHREAWIAWRSATMADFYRRLHATFAADDRSKKLYLTSTHAWQRADLRSRLQPALPSKPPFETLLVESGIDVEHLSRQPGLVWVRPYRETSFHTPTRQAATWELNRDESLDRLAASAATPAGMVFHEPQSIRLESLEKQSPFQPAYVRLSAQPTASGPAARRRLVQQLAAYDAAAIFTGGWTIPLGDEADVRRIASLVCRLPEARFATLSGTPSHVVVRTLSRGGRTYLYVVNRSAWPTTVTFDVDAAAGCEFRSFDDGPARGGYKEESGRRRWQARLEAYDVAGGEFLQAGVKPSNVKVEDRGDVAGQLTERIRQLWIRTSTLQSPPMSSLIPNPSFEEANSGETVPTGWTAIPSNMVAQTVDDAHDGRSFARLRSQQGVTVFSVPLTATPASGRLSVSVWLKHIGKEQPLLRLGVAGIAAGRNFYRYAPIGREPGAPELASEWRQFVFPLRDLPTQGLKDVRVRFELTGPGEVYIDDVQLSELDFTPNERLELSKAITLAEYRLQRGELGACAELLDGYWPRFLTQYVPVETKNVPLTASRDAVPAKPAEVPGLRDRVKSWVPSFLR